MPRISKTVSSFNELGTADKRLVGKLVKMLAENQLDGTARSKVTRLLRKIHNPAGVAVASKTKRANGYVEFYKARFQDVRDNNKGVPMTDLAKVIGAEWQALDQGQKDAYSKRAAQSRQARTSSEDQGEQRNGPPGLREK